MKEWKNQKSEGKVFSINIGDKTGQIKCTFFGKNANKFFNKIEVKKKIKK